MELNTNNAKENLYSKNTLKQQGRYSLTNGSCQTVAIAVGSTSESMTVERNNPECDISSSCLAQLLKFSVVFGANVE